MNLSSLFFILKIEENPEKIREILRKILEQRQFAGLKNSEDDFLTKFLKSLLSNEVVQSILKQLARFVVFLGKLMSPQSPFFYIFMGIILTILIFYMVRYIKKRISKTRFEGHDEEEEDIGSINPVIREKQGFSSALSGDFNEAIRHLYISLLLFLNLKGILEFKLSRTNRETEGVLKNLDSQQFLENFRVLNRIFEDKIYALNHCNEVEYKRFREAYDNCRRGLSEL